MSIFAYFISVFISELKSMNYFGSFLGNNINKKSTAQNLCKISH
ncbi:hypothetical protein J807_3053 [Acinetobacter sp. 25977_4]|nr:hypothetical protein J807_3053 [Acinetobacter sp. 25977_4]KCX95373.1 hypothetical protein J568_0133 [Acinetobacter baumannii 6112]